MNDAYEQWLKAYEAGGYKAVEGWVSPQMMPILRALHITQQEQDITGGALEIGVHHGRFFMMLNGMVAPGEGPSFAIDLFEDQALNIDRSGEGDSSQFLENLRLYDRQQGQNVTSIAGDSTRLRQGDLSQFQKTPPKIISVDGGHTVEHTISDMMFAEAVVHAQGAVILDDILNSLWIGVVEGAITYLQRRPTLWPLFIGYNKLVLVPMSVHRLYYNRFQRFFPAFKPVTMCGYPLLATQ